MHKERPEEGRNNTGVESDSAEYEEGPAEPVVLEEPLHEGREGEGAGPHPSSAQPHPHTTPPVEVHAHNHQAWGVDQASAYTCGIQW